MNNNIHELKSKKYVYFIRLLPNFITILALSIGFSAIRFALDSKWETAIFCVVIASLLDGIDGRVARYLKATSKFGSELDSLCDFANFGITPAFLIFFWIHGDYDIRLFSWVGVLFYVICMVLRLARFNTFSVDQNHIMNHTEQKLSSYFQGIPAPCAAILMVQPIVLDFEILKVFNFSFREHSLIILIYQIFISILAISTIPTISLKKVSFPLSHIRLLMILFVFFIISLVIFPWISLPFYSLIYLLSIIYTYKKSKSNNL